MTEGESAVTAADVAKWMADTYHAEGRLDQWAAVDHIVEEFGDQFLYQNNSGGQPIDKKVLRAFRALTPDAGWSRRFKMWEPRRDGDEPGRMQY